MTTNLPDWIEISDYGYPNFECSGSAYNACNALDEIETGMIFTVESEQIVGIAWAWPIAVTVQHGALHSVGSDPRTWTGDNAAPKIAASVAEAIALARAKGWPVAAGFFVPAR